MHITTVSARQVMDPSTPQGGVPPVDAWGVVVIAVAGDVDLYSGPDLMQTMTDLLVRSATGTGGSRGSEEFTASAATTDQDGLAGSMWAVVVDLREVEFIDSYAVGVLVQGHHLARRSGRAYAMVATHPMIHKLFEITGLARVLPLHADVTSAVTVLRAARGTSPSATAATPTQTGDELPG